MATQMQTVQILFPFSSVEVQAMEEVPVCPVRTDSSPVRICAGAVVTVWNLCGVVQRFFGDGTVKTWWPKPTLADVICDADLKKAYFEFHKNGAVTSRSYDSQWYWGPVKKGVPVSGTLSHAHMCYTGDWVFDDDCRCDCDDSCGPNNCVCETRPRDEPDPMFRYSFWTE